MSRNREACEETARELTEVRDGEGRSKMLRKRGGGVGDLVCSENKVVPVGCQERERGWESMLTTRDSLL